MKNNFSSVCFSMFCAFWFRRGEFGPQLNPYSPCRITFAYKIGGICNGPGNFAYKTTKTPYLAYGLA